MGISFLDNQNSGQLLLVTMGDPNGVGPEICMRAAPELKSSRNFVPVIIGHASVLQKAAELIQAEVKPQVVKDFHEALEVDDKSIAVWEPPVEYTAEDLKPGAVCEKAGAASLAYVHHAVLSLQAGKAGAMVTAPVNKEAIEIRVPGFQGHTEYIGEMCGDPHPVLTLVHGEEWVASHVSTHVSLREACDRCKQPRILKTAKLLNEFLKKFRGLENPRLGIAGLNPHAGENGLFGREEIEEIKPAVEALVEGGINATGPLPGDVVFPQMKAGTFDGVVAMYHDQGHVVTKTLGFSLGEERKLNGVNLTLGLDVIRTSVDHGTGFDIAWQNRADHHSLMDAVEVAARLL